MQSLEGPRLKLNRAEEHLNTLKDKLRVWGNDNPRLSRGEFNADRTEGRYFIDSDLPAPPVEWGIHVGEIAYQLRSGLDQLLWQVSRHRNPAIPDETHLYFPIRKAPSKSGVLSELAHLDKVQKTRIEALQPYNRTNSTPARDPLWVVHSVNIADKHLTVPLVVTNSWIGMENTLEISDVEISDVVTMLPGERLKRGTEIFRFRVAAVTGPQPDMKVKLNLMFNIEFDHFRDIISGIPVIPTFRQVINDLEQLITDFEGDT